MEIEFQGTTAVKKELPKFQFDVVDRSNLPIALTADPRYSQLYNAAISLPGNKTIVIRTSHGQRHLSSIYATLQYRLQHDDRFKGLKVSQRDKKLFIFRTKTEGGK